MIHQDVNSPKYPSGDYLRKAIIEISSLISLSHTIRLFPIKWQIIRTKLENLNKNLITAENCHPTTVTPLFDLVSSVFVTVVECQDLADRCINVTFSGKLLMQSDLDFVISKLDSHLKDIVVFCSVFGILSNGFALIVSKPGVGATKDDMKFYINDLLTRVKIGDFEMKYQALILVNEIVTLDEKYVKIVVEIDEFVVHLVGLLDSNESRIQEEAVLSIGVISRFECYKSVLISSGVIAPLIRVIEIGTLRGKQDGLRSLRNLTSNGENSWALCSHGGVTALLGICSREPSSPELAGLACWVLKNIVIVDEIKRFMIEENVVNTLIEMIKGNDEMAQISSCETIHTMVICDESVSHLFVKQRGIAALVRIFDPNAAISFKSRETSLKVIEYLCFSSEDHVNLLINYGFIDQLLVFIRNGDVSLQELAIKSASRLCGLSEEARKSMGDIGFMTEFAKFLEAKSYEIREMAAETLCHMMTVPKNRKKFAQEDKYIGLILKLLDPKDGNPGNFEFLLSILLSIINCNHARRKISHSGYVKNIELLADSGVSDAKKLVRKLSTNRFKSLLNGIWHH